VSISSIAVRLHHDERLALSVARPSHHNARLRL
jgi:hypothetical protein